MFQALSPSQLRRTFDPKMLGVETTAHLKTLEGIIGQKRAVSALQFGLEIHDKGFNIYVAGPPGIGKMTAVQAFLEERARRKATPPDCCYVNNFEDSYQPKGCQLPAGRGHQLQQDMKSLIEHIRREIPKAFESEEYNHRRNATIKTLDKQRTKVLERVGILFQSSTVLDSEKDFYRLPRRRPDCAGELFPLHDEPQIGVHHLRRSLPRRHVCLFGAREGEVREVLIFSENFVYCIFEERRVF